MILAGDFLLQSAAHLQGILGSSLTEGHLYTSSLETSLSCPYPLDGFADLSSPQP